MICIIVLYSTFSVFSFLLENVPTYSVCVHMRVCVCVCVCVTTCHEECCMSATVLSSLWTTPKQYTGASILAQNLQTGLYYLSPCNFVDMQLL